MCRRLALFLLLLAALVLAAPGAALAEESPPSVRAGAVLVADGRTGEVLLERDADRRLAMASITKLMTALVTLDNAGPQDRVTVRGPASSIGESTIALEPGEKLTVRALLTAALVQSANDAAYALAVHVGKGSVRRFVRLMNQKAAELGLENTRYVRPDGLDVAGHYSSAHDTLVVAQAAMENRLIRRLVRLRDPRLGERRLHTWNDLLRSYRGAIGVKTGHTDRAGWSQVAAARRDGVFMYAVLLGGATRAGRNADLAELLDWGFSHYGRVTAISAGGTYASAALPFDGGRLPLVAAGGDSVVIRLGTSLVERVVAPALVAAPVTKGQQLGEIVVTDGEQVVARRSLVAARSVSAPGLRTKIGWYAGRALDEAEGMLGVLIPGFG